MRLFRRRGPADGRHALGAAVTGIPSLAPPVVPGPGLAHVQPEPEVRLQVAVPAVPVLAVPVLAVPVPAVPVRAPVPAAPLPRMPSRREVPPEVPVPRAVPRVQLGFRDGTCADLDPSSPVSRALRELADSLTRSR